MARLGGWWRLWIAASAIWIAMATIGAWPSTMTGSAVSEYLVLAFFVPLLTAVAGLGCRWIYRGFRRRA